MGPLLNSPPFGVTVPGGWLVVINCPVLMEEMRKLHHPGMSHEKSSGLDQADGKCHDSEMPMVFMMLLVSDVPFPLQ